MVAHRGAQIIAPENTLTAFRLAISKGFKAIECDVQLTKDGFLIVLHDETVDRTTDGNGWVSKLRWKQIRALHIEGGERIPSFSEVYLLVVMHARRKLIVEIKADTESHSKHVAAALAMFLNRTPARYHKYVEVHSFWYDALIDFKDKCPGISTAAIINGGFNGQQIIDIAQRTGADGVSLGYEFISPKIVRQCHASNLFVDTWAISDATVLRRLRPFGINAMVENFTGKAL